MVVVGARGGGWGRRVGGGGRDWFLYVLALLQLDR